LACTVKVVGDVLLAGRVWHTVIESPLEDSVWVSTVAGTSSGLAVYDDLGIQSDWSCLFETGVDVKSVSKGRGGALGPAGSAVDWNVLVLVPGEPVGAVDVSPVMNLGE